ncbi:hypothetical protein LQ564_02955 [Massilia sp. G4R7]|uniref:Uncharacterized protein n=1 Tax=Massilia phyllostachyos TaxID=2898585 RepID=A0ABS8Q0J5_9BURK|nr:hypothetical protein [Massilia phyllostachyos]MCD2515267.1 hypothetical protein [Massilia phyllostachyos]
MGTSTMLIAAACLLAAPISSAAECSGRVSRAALTDTGRQAGASVLAGTDIRGMYTLSNGQRLKLVDYYGDLVAVFEQRRPVRLEEVGVNRFASRERDVEVSWEPHNDLIRLQYPADGTGRLQRACD